MVVQTCIILFRPCSLCEASSHRIDLSGFEEDLQRKKPPQPLTQDISNSPQFVLTMEHKVVLLAVFFFFVFHDPKFRKYMLNILVQIFGAFLKTETGNLTKIGMFVYSLLYGLVLWCCVTFIDLASFHLAF